MFKSPFEKTLEKATSQLLLETDWESILQICDIIRQKDVTAKQALTAIKKKVSNENPHVAMYGLQVLESVVKNCGNNVHEELATKEYMEFLKDQAKSRNEPVKDKILELVQAWSHAFRNEPNFKIVQDTFHVMKVEGYKFPVLKEADAMFVAEKAPEWRDSDVCTRCRVQFGMVQRKHHCRACGEIYCQKCSSKTSIIPKYGIEREVRVCDSCYDQINKPSTASSKTSGEEGLPQEYLASPLSKQSQSPPSKTEQEIQEEEELLLALALSKSEHENNEKHRMKTSYSGYNKSEPSASSQSKSSNYSQSTNANVPMVDTADMDPELARYLNRNYWVQKSEEAKAPTTTPSAPVVTSEAVTTSVRQNEVNVTSPGLYHNGETETDQTQFLTALTTSIQIFINRMQSNSNRGRSIANDSSVQSLFNIISNMNPQLMTYMQEQEELRGFYEGLQDKLTQLRDAREALDSLREEHQEKKRREAEELERQRQIQMAQKLEIMRQKKHEYLELQRQMALQKLQEQEREMQMRFEQQRHLTQIRQYQSYGYPQQMYVGGPGGQPGMPQQMYGPGPGQPPTLPEHLQGVPGFNAFSPNGSQEGSPVHQQGVYQQQPPHPNMPPQNIPPESMPNQQQPPGMYGHPQSMYQPQMMGAPPPGAPGVPQGAPPGHYQIQTDGSQPQHHHPQNYPGQMNQDPNIPGQQGYPGNPPNMDQGSFSMKGMAEALPQQPGQQLYGNPQQHPPPGMMMNHPGQYAPPPGPQHSSMNAPPPQNYQQGPPQQPHPNQQQEASLICFD